MPDPIPTPGRNKDFHKDLRHKNLLQTLINLLLWNKLKVFFFFLLWPELVKLEKCLFSRSFLFFFSSSSNSVHCYAGMFVTLQCRFVILQFHRVHSIFCSSTSPVDFLITAHLHLLYFFVNINNLFFHVYNSLFSFMRRRLNLENELLNKKRKKFRFYQSPYKTIEY